MKKILFAIAAVAMVLGSASCTKDNLGKIKEVKTNDNPLNTIIVKVASDTKLAVDRDNLTPAFEEGDVIFGWDKDGNTYAYTCSGVETGVATFTRSSSGAPSADEGTMVNLVYAPGYGIEDIVDKTLDVNLAVQGETLPVVMHATGEVDAQGECIVEFSNDVAIVDIKDAVLPGAAESEEYTVAFHGKYTSLKFALSEFGFLNYEAAVEGSISSSVKAAVSADSKISKRFAVPASLEATDVIITATDADGAAYSFSAGSREIVAGKYIEVSDKEFAPRYVAQIGDNKYLRILDAVDAANASSSDVTIELLSDIDKVPHSMTFNNDNEAKVTFDFRDCMINSTMNPAVICSTSVIFVDNGPLKKGGITGTSMVLAMRGGENVIDGGNYTGHNTYGVMRVSNNTKVTVNEGVTMTADNKSRVINAGSTSSNVGGETIINGGTFKSTNWGVIRCTYGNLTINGGTFVSECDSVVYASNSKGAAEINGGYFYAQEAAPAEHPEAFVGGPGILKNVFGGKFSHQVENSYCADGKICKAMGTPEVVEDRTYSYEIVENQDAPDIVSVNGTMFKSFDLAVEEAVNYSGEGDVTLKLETTEPVEAASSILLTNANGKKITLDLNGGVIKSLTDSLITVTGGKLDIKNGKLTLATGKYKLLHIGAGGVVNTENCVFEDNSNYSNNNTHYYIISLHGKDKSNLGELYLNNGTKIIKASGWGYCLRVGYGILTTNGTVEVTGHVNPLDGSNYGKGAPLVYAYTGGKITINDGASFYSPGTGNAYVMNIATGNTAGFININGGYFYGDQLCIKDTTSDGGAAKVLTVNGGYFSHDFSSLKFKGGKMLTPCEVKHTHDGKELTYLFTTTDAD